MTDREQLLELQTTRTRGLAYFNHGRWLTDCPTCGSPIMVSPLKQDEAVCGACEPGLFSVRLVEVPVTDEDRKFEPTAQKAFRNVPDGAARRRAFERTTKHRITFPENWKEIEDVLHPRLAHFMNWLPGETIDQLIAENIENKVTVF